MQISMMTFTADVTVMYMFGFKEQHLLVCVIMILDGMRRNLKKINDNSTDYQYKSKHAPIFKVL